MEPTLPKYAWTMNRGYPENGLPDAYRFNPWRAPGSYAYAARTVDQQRSA